MAKLRRLAEAGSLNATCNSTSSTSATGSGPAAIQAARASPDYRNDASGGAISEESNTNSCRGDGFGTIKRKPVRAAAGRGSSLVAGDWGRGRGRRFSGESGVASPASAAALTPTGQHNITWSYNEEHTLTIYQLQAEAASYDRLYVDRQGRSLYIGYSYRPELCTSAIK